jgi:hypothetical protein
LRSPRHFGLVLAALLAAVANVAFCGDAPGVTEVEGRRAPILLRHPTSSFGVYAFRGEAPVPIPFQIDERDLKNRFGLEHGQARVRDESPGSFDANDVVVFMNRDLGTRGDKAHLPKAAAWVEARVGPESSPLGFAYIGTFENPLPASSSAAAYCRYDPQSDRIYAERYAVAFGAPLPTHLAFVRSVGDFGENVLSSVRARGEARILGGLITLRRSEQDLRSTLQGYHEGAVRVIRHAKYWIELPLGFKARARVDLIFYRDFVEGRATAKVMIPPRLIPADGDLTAYFDFLDLSGARLLTQDHTISDPVDGHMTESKRRLADRPAGWAALLMPHEQSFLLGLRLGGALQKLDRQLYFEDTGGTDRLGNKPAMGFRLSRVSRLDTGEHDLVVSAMLLDGSNPENVTRAANLLVSPPELAVTVLP